MIASIILLALLCVNIGRNMAKHGEKKKEKYDFWTSLIASGIMILLYYYAGVFNNF